MGKVKDRFASILYPPGTTRLEPKVSCALVLILVSFLLLFIVKMPVFNLSFKNYILSSDAGKIEGCENSHSESLLSGMSRPCEFFLFLRAEHFPQHIVCVC